MCIRDRLYSDVARSREKGSNKKFKVVIKSKFNESGESVKGVLKSKINRIQMKVGIVAVRSFRDGRVVIESGSKNDIHIITNSINEACGSILEASVPKPVSYTHLDVYKRQLMYLSSARVSCGLDFNARSDCFVFNV